jgi:hypothetical protein
MFTSEVVVPRAASAAVGAPIKNKAAVSSLHGLVMALFLQVDLFDLRRIKAEKINPFRGDLLRFGNDVPKTL